MEQVTNNVTTEQNGDTEVKTSGMASFLFILMVLAFIITPTIMIATSFIETSLYVGKVLADAIVVFIGLIPLVVAIIMTVVNLYRMGEKEKLIASALMIGYFLIMFSWWYRMDFPFEDTIVTIIQEFLQ